LSRELEVFLAGVVRVRLGCRGIGSSLVTCNLRLLHFRGNGYSGLMTHTNDTIFALSSGRPPVAIAVVRISGPRAGAALTALIGRVPEPRKAVFARVRDPQSGEVIDEALVLWFPGPASETGEDTAELQVHGGRAVIAAVLDALSRIEGLRPAEAGEFTRRAFENGKLDLTRIEGLADLIHADTEAQRRQALRQLQGLLGDKAEAWRHRIIEALALVEAQIDFPDEGDVPQDLAKQALHVARELIEDIDKTLKGSGRSERLRDGLVVAIAGPPNAGKSSLINVLARRDVAIVSPTAGTTRDVIEVHLDLGGYPIILLDTAGIRDSDDPVEQEGVRRARARAEEADLILWIVDVAAVADPALIVKDIPGDRAGDIAVWIVCNKVDLTNATVIDHLESALSTLDYPCYPISAHTGDGISALLAAVASFAEAFFAGASDAGLVGRARQRADLTAARMALAAALTVGVGQGAMVADDILAEEFRLAARALGRLTGRIDVEDVLDVIFRDFCVGK
jgi:tRNA modification GTPase